MPAPPRACGVLFVVVLAAVLLAESAAAQRRTMTPSLSVVRPPGLVRLSVTDLSLLQVRSPYLFPITTIDAAVVNNSLLDPLPQLCVSTVTQGGIEAVVPTARFSTPGAGSTGTGAGGIGTPGSPPTAPTPGGAADGVVQWEPGLIDGVTRVNDTAIRIAIRGRYGFYVEDRQQYRVRVPAACLESVSAPPPAMFTVHETDRSQLGRIFTFVYLVAAIFAVAALVVGGSLSILFPVQLVATLASCGCGPVEFQEEFIVLRWTLVPLHTPAWERSDHADFNLLLGNYLFIIIVAALEAAHLVYVAMRFPGYFDHLFAAFSMQKSPLGVETRDKKGRRWENRFLLPPYVLLCAVLGLLPGTVRFGVRSILREETNTRLLVAFVAVALCFFVLPVVMLGLSRNKAMGFVNYQASRGRIPRWLRPTGVWGGNVCRLTVGIFFEDFRRGRRAIGAGLVFYASLFSAIAGANPRSADACRNQQWLFAFLSAAAAGYLYAFRPYRAKFFNHGHVFANVALTAVCVFYLARAGYHPNETDVAHWSNVGLYTSGIVHAVAVGVVACGHLVVAAWEASGLTAFRTVNGDVGRLTGSAGTMALALQMPDTPFLSGKHGSPSVAANNQSMFDAPPPDVDDEAGDGDDADGDGGAARRQELAERDAVPVPAGLDGDAADMYRDMVRFFQRHPVTDEQREAAQQALIEAEAALEAADRKKQRRLAAIRGEDEDKNSDDDDDDVAQRRAEAKKREEEAAARDAEKRKGRTLAEYLLDDYSALPQQTREEMVLWERLSRAKADNNRRLAAVGRLNEPLQANPELYMPPRPKPLRDRPPVTVDFL